MIAIVDYGVGNLFSLKSSFGAIGVEAVVTAQREVLEKADCMDRAELPYQKAVIDNELPYTIGGGIGQSRICMFFLRKAHIGEVHSSLWPAAIAEECEKNGVQLL